MDFLQNQKSFFALYFFLTLSSSSLFSIKADHYFINCGSNYNVALNDGRHFAGYPSNPADPGVNILASSYSVVLNTGRKPELYKSSMVFTSPATYRFSVIEHGTYILRLHFYAFSSPISVADSRFNVSASAIMLLSNFSPNPNSLEVQEFLLAVNTGEFDVFFVPCSPSTVAFVNAIELFLAPLKTFTGSPVAVSPGIDTNLVSRVLHPVYRINFGGQTVPSSYDRLWRTWLSDDPYLQWKISAKNGPIRISRPNYREGNSTELDAPDAVYNTAKELNQDLIHSENFFNATWLFNVSKASTYLVRVHFCDMISPALGEIVFNLYVGSHFVQKIDPYEAAPYLAAPFYLDFIAESDALGVMSISISPRNDTRITENAFINGLEIMEILFDRVIEPRVCDSGLSKQSVVVVAVVGLIAFLFGRILGLIGVIALSYVVALKNPNVIKLKPAQAFSYWPLVNLELEKIAPDSGKTPSFI